jgi:hypothetical protein
VIVFTIVRVKLPLQRRVSIAVLGLALAGFAADRFVIGSGSPAIVPAPASGAPAEAPRAGSTAPAANASESVADRLGRARRAETAHPDAFVMPTGWLPKVSPGQADGAPAAHEAGVVRLTAVFPNAKPTPKAIINGMQVGEGDMVDGYRVVKILGTERGARPGVSVVGPDGRAAQYMMEPKLTQKRTGNESRLSVTDADPPAPRERH